VTEGKIADLTVTNKLSAKSFQLEHTKSPSLDQSVVTSDRNGNLQVSDDLEIKSLKVQNKLMVAAELEAHSLRIQSLKPMSVVVTDANGYLTSNQQISVSIADGMVRIQDLAVDSMRSDVNFQQHKLINGVISKSEIINSDIIIGSETKKGFDESSLAIVDQVFRHLYFLLIAPPPGLRVAGRIL
jgi:hypothetical protein